MLKISLSLGSTEPSFQKITHVGSQLQQTILNATNTFGLYHEYQDVPDKIPDEHVDVTDLTENDMRELHSGEQDDEKPPELGAFPNTSTLNFLHWFWNCGLKPCGE